jgi:tRNA(His) guanylyltransferase
MLQTVKDALGARMKQQYENRSRYSLPRRTYTIIRIDGKAFHTYTKHCDKPWDSILASALDIAARRLCIEAHGSKLAYVQSDEISLLLTDFANPKTEGWFDGNVQKIASVSASIVTAVFNRVYQRPEALFMEPPTFDARVFTIPDPVEVANYFIWRQQDATRNAIMGMAQAHFSHGQLLGVNCNQAQEMLFAEKGINFNDVPTYWKRGRCIVPRGQGGSWHIDRDIPIFTQDRAYLNIPKYGEEEASADNRQALEAAGG